MLPTTTTGTPSPYLNRLRRAFTGLALLALGGLSSLAPRSHAGDEGPWLPRIAAARAHLAEQQAIPAAGVTLVEAGKPVATIVHDEESSKTAKMLNEWISLMTGVELPLATEAPAAGTPVVYLGAPAIAAGATVAAIPSKSQEGLHIKADGKAVYIAAQSSGALGRAAGRFLEEAFGCRYLSTNNTWGRTYPTLQTLRVRDMDLTEAPTMVFRRIWGANGAFRNDAWCDWNGHGGTNMPMSHSWSGMLTKEDFEAHPEYFRMDEKGERVYGHWPNFGNDTVRQKFVDYAIGLSDDGKKSISLSPPDSYTMDYSPEATKYDNPNMIVASTQTVSMTDRFMGVVNEAAKALYKKNPDLYVGFYAYSDYTMPPTFPELQELSPNVCVWIAPIRYSRFHPLGHPNSVSRQELLGIVDGWSKVAKQIGYRTYNYNLAEILTPFSKLSIWTHDIPYLYSRGCIGFNLESMDSWELSAPHLWLSIRLAYDPTLDPHALVADYMVASYGPAAEAMTRYWTAVDAAWVNQKTEAGSIHSLPQVYTPEHIAALDALLKEAEAAAPADSPIAYRVNLARRGWQRAVYWRTWYDQFNAGDIDGALATYEVWNAFTVESIKKKDGNDYDRAYLSRFVNSLNVSASKAIHPADAPARKVVAVMPDTWRFAYGEYAATYAPQNPWDVDLPELAWPKVQTYGATLSAQGYGDYFGDIWYRTDFKAPATTGPLFLHLLKADRKITVYLNGKQVNAEEVEGFRGATVDVSGFVKPGEQNQLTLKIRHVPLPELFLGGLLGPVYLIEGGK